MTAALSTVIASEAKQSSLAAAKKSWIASVASLLAMTVWRHCFSLSPAMADPCHAFRLARRRVMARG
jgi:hypothetical protein